MSTPMIAPSNKPFLQPGYFRRTGVGRNQLYNITPEEQHPKLLMLTRKCTMIKCWIKKQMDNCREYKYSLRPHATRCLGSLRDFEYSEVRVQRLWLDSSLCVWQHAPWEDDVMSFENTTSEGTPRSSACLRQRRSDPGLSQLRGAKKRLPLNMISVLLQKELHRLNLLSLLLFFTIG